VPPPTTTTLRITGPMRLLQKEKTRRLAPAGRG